MKVDGGIPSGTPLTLLHLLTHTSGIGTGKLGEAQASSMPARVRWMRIG